MNNFSKFKISMVSSLFFVSFGIFMPIFITLFYRKISISLVLLTFLALYEVYKLMRIMISTKIRLLELTYHSFVYLFLVIAPIVQIASGRFPLGGGFLYTETEVVLTILVITIGIAFYELGIKKGDQRVIVSEPSNAKLNLHVINALALFFMLLAAQKFGGITNLGGDRSAMDSTVSLIMNSLLRAPIYIALVLNLIQYRDKRDNNERMTGLGKITLGILFILNIIASNPYYTSRYWFGAIFISCCLIFLKWKKSTTSTIILSTMFGFLVLFPYADVSRSDGEFLLSLDAILNNLKVGDFDAFQQIMNTLSYVKINGYSFGGQLLGAILFFVPRSIWLNKPLGTGFNIGLDLNYVNKNISAPLWSEFYVNFSIVGIIIMFFLYGYITAVMQNEYIATKGKMNFYQLFVPFYSFYQFFLLRGDLLSSFSNLIPVMIFTALFLKLKKKNNLS
ncbi:hypothetical protein [Trichococcus alkaliphilus]|uniref:hypothetical protein n=1 Tax=Trichococcus alkaliphilus TaxID=2052943 RepID=UPI000D0BAF30|nr:hypothetical protein [Trichococcus alkaliphilus]